MAISEDEKEVMQEILNGTDPTVTGLHERTKRLADRVHGVAMADLMGQLFYVSVPRGGGQQKCEVGLSFARSDLPLLHSCLTEALQRIESIIRDSKATVQ